MYINRATLYGNLTKDPQLKSLPSGTQVTELGVATNRTWKDKNGVKQESVEYHNCVAFAKQAELIAQYLKKGQPIYLEGRIQTRSWDAQDGTKKYRTEIVVENFQFGPKGVGSGGSYTPKNDSAEKQEAPKDEPGQDINYPEEQVNAEDIPF